MRDSTSRLHEQAVQLGEALGFIVDREASNTCLSLISPSEYCPRLDVVWSLPLTPQQAVALQAITGSKRALDRIPIVGIEIEGTTPSTKTMQADIANLAAHGAPFSLLIVTEKGERGIYGRAARMVRTLGRFYGKGRMLPVEGSWLKDLASRPWAKGWTQSLTGNQTPAGGETSKWVQEIRKKVRRRGEEAGFEVQEPLIPSGLAAEFEWAQALHGDAFDHLYLPLTGKRRAMKSAKDWYTESKLDLGWLLPLPAAFKSFLEELCERDASNQRYGLIHPLAWAGHLPLVAFEFESATGKHAQGSLLNLGAHAELGVLVVETEAARQELQSALKTYQHVWGLPNVFVKAEV